MDSNILENNPIDAILFNEPVIEPNSNIYINSLYSLSQPEDVPSPSSNPHLPTCTLSYDESAATVSPAALPETHPGLTSVRLSYPATGQLPIYIMNAYIPNPSAETNAYAHDIFAAIAKNALFIKSIGGAVFVGMDSDCPVKTAGVLPPRS